MSATLTEAATTLHAKDTSGRIFFLDLGGGRLEVDRPADG